MRYLFNAITDPLRANRLARCLRTDQLERNPGDMVYAYAVANALATSPTDAFVPTGYYRRRGFADREIAEWNELCDAFVCPLADVFSGAFLWLVRDLTSLVRRLNMPCVVPCVGFRAIGDDGSER